MKITGKLTWFEIAEIVIVIAVVVTAVLLGRPSRDEPASQPQPEETEGEASVIVNIDSHDKKPLQMKFGFNEYVIESRPYYRFNEPAYVDALRDSGAQIMRFPGGTIANFYDWKNDDFMTEDIRAMSAEKAVPRDRFDAEDAYKAMVDKFRQYLDSYVTKGTKMWETRGKYGYSDFLDMTRQIGADISYVGNISMAPGGTDPVDHLAAWMQSLKDQGVSVRYLELGNEIVAPANAAVSNVQAIPNGLYDLDKYMSVAEEASKRIKTIFPQIKIGLLADGFSNRIGNDAGKIDLLDRQIMSGYNTDFFDAVVIHTYLRTTDRNEEDMPIRRDKLFALSKETSEHSAQYWRDIFPGKEIWMTETGYIAGSKYDENLLTGNLFTALLEADYFLHWVDYDDQVRSYIKFYSISPNQNMKSVMFWNNETHDIIKSPVYYAYSLVAGAIKNCSGKLGVKVINSSGHVVPTKAWVQSTDEQEQKIPGVGKTQALDITVDDLTARAFLSKDGKTIYVAYINKSETPVKIALQIDGKQLAAETIGIESISGNWSDTNTLRAPHTVEPVMQQEKTGEAMTLLPISIGVITIPLK